MAEPGAGLPLGREYSCGLCSLQPHWLQRFANKQSFLTIFCLTSILQGMYYTYFVSVLTTIEKLYQIQSKTTGIIMSATEIGQIGGALLLTYYGGQGHRPRWIACGMLVFALASVLCSTPHYLFGGPSGPASHSSFASSHFAHSTFANITNINNMTTNTTSTNQNGVDNRPVVVDFSTKLCSRFNASSLPQLVTSLYHADHAGHEEHLPDNQAELLSHALAVTTPSKCDDPDLTANQLKVTQTVLTIFFASLFLIGIGSTAVNTLGIPYIDDNVAPRESPLYFGITIGVRIFGPVFGFLLGSICTSVYVDFPFGINPGLSPNDPQWIGAWWLGVLIVGFTLTVTSLPMMAFPKKLPQPDPSSYCHKQQQNSIKEQQLLVTTGNGLSKSDKEAIARYNDASSKAAKKPSLKEFPAAVKRLLKNDILLCRTASSVLHILPIAGLYTFLPKYLESQFQLTASRANMISGIAGILVMGIGIFASGLFMRKYKPDARFVARWIACAALLYAIGMVILMWLGCPLNKIVGLNAGDHESTWNSSYAVCDKACFCPSGEFAPICTSEGVTYISPCLAGCTRVSSINSTYIYSDCKCLGPSVTAVNGYCDLDCDNLTWYILTFSFFVLIHSTSEVGSMLLTLRCVDPQDKAMALGLISFAIGLFGNVPCPIIYGAVVDSACLFWEYSCGQIGACRVYDPSKFRMVFHGVTAVIMFVAFLVDAVVWVKASSIRFHEEDDEVAVQDDLAIDENVIATVGNEVAIVSTATENVVLKADGESSV